MRRRRSHQEMEIAVKMSRVTNRLQSGMMRPLGRSL